MIPTFWGSDIFPRGLVIGTHDGEFGEWVPVVKKRECEVVLVEASDSQFQKLKENYPKNQKQDEKKSHNLFIIFCY